MGGKKPPGQIVGHPDTNAGSEAEY